ncbi:MAG: filamentous hemagglutinin N-terminal domain-containing protein, partial [Verrucomicrobiaceae bacterium]
MITPEKSLPFEWRPRPLPLAPAVAWAVLLLSCAVQAGDILRGGAAPNAPAPRASYGTNGAAAAQARSNAKDALARTQQALQSVKNAQAAARAAAVGSGATNLGADPNHPGLQLPNVPDGLGVGGLDFTSATGASAPTQSGNSVTVRQNVQQALLDWKTFNVGSKTTIHFDQTAGGADVGQWIAFNRVTDPSGVPSQILGSIKAEGQVYIINQNGIIFGGGSQVNVHALVAASLPINMNLVNRGLLNNPNLEYLFSGLPQSAPLPPNGKYGAVVVQPGAVLSAPTSAEHVGGRIALVGANVSNGGTLSTPDGQVILAAGLQIGFEAHKSSDPAVRGLDVYVGAVSDGIKPNYAGTVTNSGLIEVLRGNATLAGKSIFQQGAINSSTSV